MQSGVSMSGKVIHEEPARRAGWIVIAGLCALLSVAPELELGVLGRGVFLIIGVSSLHFGLSRAARSVWLEEESGSLIVRQTSLFGSTERRIRLSDIGSVECITVSVGTEEGNGYRLRIVLKSGENVWLTRSFASRTLAGDAPESPPFKIARMLREKMAE
jgi:hypothetical protein